MSHPPHALSPPSMPAKPQLPARQPSIALALGGGGARGLAHILMLEVFDELGLKPKVIAGTSIGAIFGAAYASGLSGKEIRAQCEVILGERLGLFRELMAARATTSLLSIFSLRSALLEPGVLLDILMPRGVATDFAHLAIPLKVVATDFYGQDAVVFQEGPLRRAVAASMALPALFQPVVIDGRALIDGGLVNPLPFDLLQGMADIVVAIDVAGAPLPSEKREWPSATEALWAASFIFERTIIREKLKQRQPDIYVDAGTGHFQVLDFLKFNEILKRAEPAKERFKAQLLKVLTAETLTLADAPAAPVIAAHAKPKRRLGRSRLAE